MSKVIVKALIVLWPFLKSIIFKDRPVREVLRANRHFTWLFIIMLFVIVVFGATIDTLAGTQRFLNTTLAQLKEIQTELETVKEKYETLKEEQASINECRPNTYDKSRLMEMLE